MTNKKPTKPGWYWAREDVQHTKPGGVKDQPDVVVRIEQGANGLEIAWLSGSGKGTQASVLHLSEVPDTVMFEGPIKPPK